MAGHNVGEYLVGSQEVERLEAKSAAEMLPSSRISNKFDAICRGAGDKGTWVGIFHQLDIKSMGGVIYKQNKVKLVFLGKKECILSQFTAEGISPWCQFF